MADEDDRGGPPSLPNPLAGNDIKLTLPTPARYRSMVSPPSAEPDETDAAVDDAVVDIDTTDVEIRPDEDATDEAAADPGQGDESETGSVDESFETPRRRAPDKGILKVLAFGVVAVLVVVVAVIGFAVNRSEAPEPEQQPANPGRFQGAAGPQVPPPPGPAVVDDAPIPITVTAVCPGQTEPRLAADPDARSAWRCPLGDGAPFGQVLDVQFPDSYVVSSVEYWPGGHFTGPDGKSEWSRHKCIMEQQVVFDDRDRTVVTGSPRCEHALFTLKVKDILATSFKLTILATADPPAEAAATPTKAPPGTDGEPDLGSVFTAAPDPDDQSRPMPTTVAIHGLIVKGHRYR
ncbi:hypothetical protein [Mycobacteroides abscessus]|uniref:hypothetical protein n=1 Tax=Mycobacteroides abscessus TaxID=36809 RepID=UPI00092BD8EF|nr:hypothetical protein [Mycobacteroides abscessus]SIC21787.1 Uncharacterised protein [Mycobacteroides abscessus subsp. abscessus]